MLRGTVAQELGLMVARGLAPIVAAGFLRDLTDDVIKDTEKHVVGVGRLRVVGKQLDDDFSPVGFTASDVKKVSLYRPNDNILYHLGGVIVADQNQNRGIGRKLIADELKQTSATLLGLHTQNLLMLTLAHRMSEYSFSFSSGLANGLGTPDPELCMLGERMSVVHLGRYGGQSLYGDREEFGRRRMQIKGLNTNNGDAIVYVGEVK